jgi:hypothetical protein
VQCGLLRLTILSLTSAAYWRGSDADLWCLVTSVLAYEEDFVCPINRPTDSGLNTMQTTQPCKTPCFYSWPDTAQRLCAFSVARSVATTPIEPNDSTTY